MVSHVSHVTLRSGPDPALRGAKGDRNGPSTPYVLIDETIMDPTSADGTSLFPAGMPPAAHVKTHKIPEIALRQIAAGACGVTVAKLGEAEAMAEGGIRDIFMAYPLVGADKIARAVALSRSVGRLILAADSLEGARALSVAAQESGAPLEIRLEVDTGLRRTGVPYGEAAALARAVAALPGLKLTGLYTFRSMILDGKPTLDREAAGRQEGQLLAALKRELEGLGQLETSGGSTPTGFSRRGLGVDEIRPAHMCQRPYEEANGSCAAQDCALRVVYTVVSVPEPGRIVLDGGSKSISSDVAPGAPPYHLGGYGGCPEDSRLVLERLTEEHGMASLLPGSRSYRVGDRVSIVPNHVCTTVNLYDTVYIRARTLRR